MKKFIIEKELLNIFPEVEIGILVCNGIENHIVDENKYADYLKKAQAEAKKHIMAEEFTANPIIRTWRDAFYKFKTKKGARCSIEALLKRISQGKEIGCINPLVDLYNGISMKYGVPVGGEDIDKFVGDVKLTLAAGGEEFITYGSDESDPPAEGEVVYKDDKGAICRCFNWREGVRTMLTEDTKNAFMIIETVDGNSHECLDAALDELKALIEKELGATVTKHFVNAASPEMIICE